jgi:hypothetical protein
MMGGGFGGPNNQGGPQGNPPSTNPADQPSADPRALAQDLQTAIENNATADQVKTKVEALRAALSKAKEKLVKAQADLKAAVNPTQEAELIGLGLLD